ncbi:MAG: FKBP-type peptidyl-prolyl cis-trans isomerase [Alphaproteobacteria bacterium]
MQHVIGFHYTLKNKIGMVLDSSDGQDAMLFLSGASQIIPGLEKRMEGLSVGDKETIMVPAGEAYGELDAGLQITATKSQFPPDANLKEGDQFKINEEPGAPVFKVVKIEGENVHIDGNHPMAGKDLYFDIEITEKRDATKDELAHGHAHGAGGHHH